MMLEWLQTNYACLVVCILFFGFVITDKSFGRKITVLFLMAMGVALCLTIVDGLELMEAQLAYPTVLRKIYSAIGYTLRPATAILIVIIMHRNTKRSLRTGAVLLQCSLFILNGVFSFVSIFNNCVFGYTPDNQFFRGPFGILPFITAGVYIVFMVIETLLNIKVRRKDETAVVFIIAFLSIMGTVLEVIFKLDGTLNISCAIGVFFYYLYIHVNVYTKDQLTSVYSRRIFYLDIEKLHKAETVLVGIDLNYLKKINDEGGHSAGDTALITLANVIHKNMLKGCSLYRMGGDEFMLLCRHMQLRQADEMMKHIERELAPTGYSFAYGCALFKKGNNIDAATNEADANMYAMKSAMKAVREE